MKAKGIPMGKISDLAKAGAKKALDRNKDGVVDRQDAVQLATTWEERFPLGVIIGCTAAGFVIGFYFRGVFG